MIHPSFVAWVKTEIIPKSGQLRLDGLTSGENRNLFGQFRHQGKRWEVHGDTRIEKVMVAYNAIASKSVRDPFVPEPATTRLCLNLVKPLLEPRSPKHLYIYESK